MRRLRYGENAALAIFQPGVDSSIILLLGDDGTRIAFFVFAELFSFHVGDADGGKFNFQL
jgi:hypothetical protein